jgi:hypothetical protein
MKSRPTHDRVPVRLSTPDVAGRLIAELECAFDESSSLLESVRGRDFTHAESIQHARIVRRIAVVSSALHGRGFRALTHVERIWLAAQGVPTDRRAKWPLVTRVLDLPQLIPLSHTTRLNLTYYFSCLPDENRYVSLMGFVAPLPLFGLFLKSFATANESRSLLL